MLTSAVVVPKGEKNIFAWLHACHMIIWLLFAKCSVDGIMNGNASCVVDNRRLNCFGEITPVIYGEIDEVYISQFDRQYIHISSFDDDSWNQVKILTIEVREDINLNRIENGTFQSLDSLTELTFRCWLLQELEAGAFGGLSHLRLLNLSGNTWLDEESLMKALHAIPAIDTLILDGMGSVFNRVVHFGQEFVDILRHKGIKHFSLSNTNLYFENINFMQEALPLKTLNLSHSQMYQENVDTDIVLHQLLRNVRVLDISGFDKRFIEPPVQTFHLDCNMYNNVIIYIFGLEQLYCNDVNRPEFVVNDSVLNASLCQCNLKVWQWRSFNLKVLNVTVYWPNDSPLIDVDMSRNAMEYFSIKGYITVSKLNLSHNQLSMMQANPDYAHLVDAFALLEDIDLNNNGLTYIPKDIFRRNKLLKYIRMHDNYLTRFEIDIAHLNYLRYLDLRQNRIKFIEIHYLNVFDNLRNLQASMNRTSVFDIDLRNNEIECSCSNFKFVEWIVSKKQINPETVYHVACYMDGRKAEMIHQGTLRGVDFLCKRTLVIILSSGAGLVCVAIAFRLSVFFMRRNTKNKIRKFIDRFKNRKTKEKFLALISHSEKDGKIVYDYIRHHLEQEMRNVLQVDFDLICLGDIHFRPGMAIVDEIYKSVSDSCVAMFVISRAFCESGWCKCELKEAYGQNKPIILMFVEEVDEDNMTPLIQNIFRKYTRVKLTQHNGEGDVVVSQSWDSISQSIIYLAVDEYRNRRHMCF